MFFFFCLLIYLFIYQYSPRSTLLYGSYSLTCGMHKKAHYNLYQCEFSVISTKIILSRWYYPLCSPPLTKWWLELWNLFIYLFIHLLIY